MAEGSRNENVASEMIKKPLKAGEKVEEKGETVEKKNEVAEEKDEASAKSKRTMTDEERLALCQTLDRELDEFIDGLEKKRYTDGWSEETWEEEMEKHPFFMKSTPDSKLSPLAEGLAKLKYDPEENTPVELAKNYKEDGNYNFKYKNYRLAILSYTEGIRAKPDDPELLAILYNNRAAAQWQLKNYRSCLSDCETALKHNPKHVKARLRAAKSARETGKYDVCIHHCETLLEDDPDNGDVTVLLRFAKSKKRSQDRDLRREQRLEIIKNQQKNEILRAILERNLKIAKVDRPEDLDLQKLEPQFPGCDDAMVSIRGGMLYWPVVLLYPEFKMTDFIKGCPEDVSLSRQIAQVFPAPWDNDNRYTMKTIHIYTEGWDRLPHRVDPEQTLGEIMAESFFVVKAGSPAFCIVVKNSAAEKRYIDSYLRI